MEAGNPNNGNGKTREIVAGIKVIESEYRVQRPVFEDVKVDRVCYVDKQVEVPVGLEKVCVQLADEIFSKVLALVDGKLEKAISARIKEIEFPKITYKEEVKTIEVEKVVLKDVEVLNPKLKDVEVLNPILVDKKVVNPVFIDAEVERPIFKDRVIINPTFEDVIITKPKYIEKEIVVIHPKYIDMKGNPE